MTSGTRVEGDKTPVTTESGSTFTYGAYRTKVWSGNDYSPGPRPQPTWLPNRSRWVWVNELGVRKRIYLGRQLNPLPRHAPRRGDVVEHAYSMSYDYRHENVYRVRTNPFQSFVEVTAGQDGGYIGVSDWGWTANDDLKLLGKLRNGVAGSDFNAGVALGEGGKALGMMFGAAGKVFNAYGEARKGNLFSAARILLEGTGKRMPTKKTAANNWLELQYGWLPLVNDVYEGAIFLAHHLNVPLQKIYRVTRRVPATPIWGNHIRYNYPRWKSISSKRIKAIIKEKDIVGLAGLLDPLSVMWELLPYSFVIDWFIPVGSYLQNRGLAQSLTGTFVTSAYHYFDSGDVALVGQTQYGSGTSSQFHHRQVEVVRTVSTTLAVPLPGFKPLMDVPSWRRCANGIALGIQKHRS